MKSQNEKEFKALIKKYESITLKQLKEEDRESDIFYSKILTRITGFGNTTKCTLCNATRKSNPNHRKDCTECVYGMSEDKDVWNECIENNNEFTYNAISNATSIESLLLAIKSRAKHMREVYKQYLKQR